MRLLLAVLLGLALMSCQRVDRADAQATLRGALAAAGRQDQEALLDFYRPSDRQALALGLAASRGAGVTSAATLENFSQASPLLILQEPTRAVFDLEPPSQALLTLEKLEGRWYICLPDAAPALEPLGGAATQDGGQE